MKTCPFCSRPFFTDEGEDGGEDVQKLTFHMYENHRAELKEVAIDAPDSSEDATPLQFLALLTLKIGSEVDEAFSRIHVN